MARVRDSGFYPQKKKKFQRLLGECADPFLETVPSTHPHILAGESAVGGESDLWVFFIGSPILQLRKLDRWYCKAG